MAEWSITGPNFFSFFLEVLNNWIKLNKEIERKLDNEGELLRGEMEELRCELLLLANSREDYAQKRFNNRQLVDAQIAQTKVTI